MNTTTITFLTSCPTLSAQFSCELALTGTLFPRPDVVHYLSSVVCCCLWFVVLCCLVCFELFCLLSCVLCVMLCCCLFLLFCFVCGVMLFDPFQMSSLRRTLASNRIHSIYWIKQHARHTNTTTTTTPAFCACVCAPVSWMCCSVSLFLLCSSFACCVVLFTPFHLSSLRRTMALTRIHSELFYWIKHTHHNKYNSTNLHNDSVLSPRLDWFVRCFVFPVLLLASVSPSVLLSSNVSVDMSVCPSVSFDMDEQESQENENENENEKETEKEKEKETENGNRKKKVQNTSPPDPRRLSNHKPLNPSFMEMPFGSVCPVVSFISPFCVLGLLFFSSPFFFRLTISSFFLSVVLPSFLPVKCSLAPVLIVAIAIAPVAPSSFLLSSVDSAACLIRSGAR